MAVTWAKRPFWVNRVLRARRATLAQREVYERLEELISPKKRTALFSTRELASDVWRTQKAVIKALKELSTWDGDLPPVIAYIPTRSPKEKSVAVLYESPPERGAVEAALPRRRERDLDSGDPEFEKFWRYYPWDARGDKQEAFEAWKQVRSRVDYEGIEGELFRAKMYELTPQSMPAAEWLLTGFWMDE
ncbi:MAG: hypothetical protein QMC94_05970 [Anaerosomatales bacterium]|nr:hypothetical protein [Anaerosomatales bacterium]